MKQRLKGETRYHHWFVSWSLSAVRLKHALGDFQGADLTFSWMKAFSGMLALENNADQTTGILH